MTYEPESLVNDLNNPDTITEMYDKVNLNFIGLYQDMVSLDAMVSELSSLLSEQ